MSLVYRGLKATIDRHIVTEEEINRQIETIRKQNPRIELVKDRPAKLGDEIILDYAGFADGVQFPGGTAENQTLVLGSGMFIPGFEEQLVDKVPEEPVVVKVRFPDEYHAAELAGKDAQFNCTIKEIRIKSEYELDDIFAKEVGECETFAEFKEMLGNAMQAYSDERGEVDLQDRLLRQAAETYEAEFSDEAIEAGINEQLEAMRAQLSQRGLTLEMYCQFMSKTEEEIRDELRAAAEHQVRVNAMVVEIAKIENLEATEMDVAQACEIICKQNEMTIEQLQPYMDESFKAAVIRTVLTQKVVELIRENAIITEV